MNSPTRRHSLQEHFAGKDPSVLRTWDALQNAVKAFGPITVEPKKTSIHIVNKTAFAGVATRNAYLILTIKSDRDLSSPRIFRSEQTSTRRFHHEVKLTTPTEVDRELISWLKAAYTLSE